MLSYIKIFTRRKAEDAMAQREYSPRLLVIVLCAIASSAFLCVKKF